MYIWYKTLAILSSTYQRIIKIEGHLTKFWHSLCSLFWLWLSVQYANCKLLLFMEFEQVSKTPVVLVVLRKNKDSWRHVRKSCSDH